MSDVLIPGGLLIAVEGIDGAGKTTLARSLADLLDSAGLPVSMSKEPTNGQWGSILRKSASEGRLTPEREVELLLLDRNEHVKTVIRPGLNAGKVVILDRYFPSMVAYQGAHGIPINELMEHNAFAPMPDLTIVLDVDPAIGLARIAARGDVPNHFETADNLLRCRRIFLTMKLPSRRVIDASLDAASVRNIAARELIAIAAQKLADHSGLTIQNAERIRSIDAAITA